VPPAAPSLNAYRPAISAAKEQELLDSVMLSLDDVTEEVVSRAPPHIPRKRKPSPLMSSSPERNSLHDSLSNHDMSSDGMEMLDENLSISRNKRQRIGEDSADSSLQNFSKLEVNEEDYDSFFDDLNDVAFSAEIDDSPSKPAPKKFEYKVEDALEVKLAKIPDSQPAWLALHSSLATADNDTVGSTLKPIASSSITAANLLEPNDTFHFYWLDYLEVDGKVYFIGKTREKQRRTWVSCCVMLEDIQRNLYIFPRSASCIVAYSQSSWSNHITRFLGNGIDGTFSQDEVESDFETIRRKAGVKKLTSYWVKRKYAFGDKEIESGESECLKVVYGFDRKSSQSSTNNLVNCDSEPQIASDATSPNISRIMGTGTSAFELLVVKRKIMGPCWLEVKEPVVTSKGVRLHLRILLFHPV
jgi:DNA polymerase alpha subunit A